MATIYRIPNKIELFFLIPREEEPDPYNATEVKCLSISKLPGKPWRIGTSTIEQENLEEYRVVGEIDLQAAIERIIREATGPVRQREPGGPDPNKPDPDRPPIEPYWHHPRTIDATALADYIRENDYNLPDPDNKAIGSSQRGMITDSIIAAINQQKTVSPAPPTGHWMMNFDGSGYIWKCSNCGDEQYDEPGWYNKTYTKYCAECGARMGTTK